MLAAAWFDLMFFVALPSAVLFATDRSWIPPQGVSRSVGGTGILLCHSLLALQIRSFVLDGGVTHAPFDSPRRLLQDGVYDRVRNPMYLNYVLIALANTLLYRSVALTFYALFLWALAHVYRVAFEEESLRRRFGEQYESYAARIPRWFPRAR